jgi:hypothetical protein
MMPDGAPPTATSVQVTGEPHQPTQLAMPPVEVDPDADGGEEGLNANTKKLMNKKRRGKVNLVSLKAHIEAEKKTKEAFLTLPFTIAFFMIFVACALEHESVVNSSMVQREFRSMLSGTSFEGVQFTSGHKTLGDIDTKEDIYTYLQDVIVSLFLNGKDTPAQERHRVLRYNQIVGGVQIQQVRRQRWDCADRYPDRGPKNKNNINPLLQNVGCYPWDTESDECMIVKDWPVGKTGWCPDSKVNAARRLDYIPDGGGRGGQTKGFRDPPTADVTYSIYLYEHEGAEEALKTVKIMQDQEWIDYHSSWMGIRMLVLNPDLHIFMHVTVHVYFAPGGSLLPHITAASFRPEPYEEGKMGVLALDVLWCLLLLWMIVSLIIRLVKIAKAGHIKHVLKDEPWIVLDVAVVVCGFLCIILWLVLLNMLGSVKKSAMEVRLTEPKAAAGLAPLYPELVADLHEEVGSFTSYVQIWRLVLCWYTLLISLKFLESFAAQPRLAVVTSTISRAWVDLVHFLIVLATIFMSFVISGMFLFGRRLFDFSNVNEAIMKCWLILLGDYDWDELSQEHPWTAVIWFLLSMVLMNLLMLNMLMAIVMDTYTEVKSDSKSSKKVWEQLFDMIRDQVAVVQGKLVSNDKLLGKLGDLELEDVGVEDLQDAVPGLSKEQAESVIKATHLREEEEANKGLTISQAMRMIGWVRLAVQKIGWQLEFIKKDEEAEVRMQPKGGGDAGEGPAQFLSESDGLLEVLESRMGKMEEFMHEAEQFMSFRGKDSKNRLNVIEDLIRSERDAASLIAGHGKASAGR